MTQYLYMNERIREKKPRKPVIVAQDDLYGTTRVRESNTFDLWHHGEKIGRVVFDPKGLKDCETHDVKAWVELDDMVTVARREDQQPVTPFASAKKPGRAVSV